jgi:DNA-binding transcriptional MerR regulator
VEYSIGDFSKISRLGIKTLRYYHEIGLLIPNRVDQFTSYRYYNENCLSRVETINRLKELDFSLETIKEILDHHKNDQSLISYMQDKLADIEKQINDVSLIREKIETFIRLESSIPEPLGDVTVKDVQPVFMASVRFKGRYIEIGDHLTRLFSIFSTVANGPAFCMYHDDHHADENMNIECCLPIIKKLPAAGINYSTLPGARMVTITHEGDYSTIWMAYKKIVDYLNKKDLPIIPPSREIYLRSKGKILPGDPENFLTEIQFLVKEDEDPITRSLRKKIAVNIHA